MYHRSAKRYLSRGVVICALPLATASATELASVNIDPTQRGSSITGRILGLNMGNWFNPMQKGMASTVEQAGFASTRWPGGSNSDLYHLSTNANCFGGYVDPSATFDAFVNKFVVPAKLSLWITLNYGTNQSCNGGGDPKEAAAWVKYAKSKGYIIAGWTVGNEVYGSWEKDLHVPSNDPQTYANAVLTGYYPAIKAADPNAKVGVVVDANDPYGSPNWDSIVLSKAPYDFVEYHFYAQGKGYENDTYLIQDGPKALAAKIDTIKQELASVGRPNTPIMIGELGSVNTNPGKQSISITQALFAGQAIGELMKAGISQAMWWIGYGDCRDPSGGGNYSGSLYGWQDFGGYQIISDGLPEWGCPNSPIIPRNTLLPTAQAFKLASLVALDGERMIAVTQSGPRASDLRAYAMTNRGGVALMLFNLSGSKSLPVSIGAEGVPHSSSVTLSYYDRAAYDSSQSNVWTPITTNSLGPKSLPFPITLTPWSMTIVQIK